MWKRILLFGLILLVPAGHVVLSRQPGNLPGTAELTWDGDLSARMVAGIDRFLMRRLEAAPEGRAALWERDFSSGSDYARSVEANRERFRKIIGVVDRRSPARLEFLSSEGGAPLAESDSVTVWRVRWDVVAGLGAEGLLVRPRNRAPIAQVIRPAGCRRHPAATGGSGAGGSVGGHVCPSPGGIRLPGDCARACRPHQPVLGQPGSRDRPAGNDQHASPGMALPHGLSPGAPPDRIRSAEGSGPGGLAGVDKLAGSWNWRGPATAREA